MKSDEPEAVVPLGAEGAIEHRSHEVYCAAREEPAVVSVISRTGAHRPIHFVLWCSLCGIGECDAGCLRERGMVVASPRQPLGRCRENEGT